MNEIEIKKSFYSKKLVKSYNNKDSLRVNELGLKHGKCRADIAVINGYLIGYEIKSDFDSIKRLSDQVLIYSKVFNRAFLILTSIHLKTAIKLLPRWWGIIIANKGSRGAINFQIIRRSSNNPQIDKYAIAQLLWHNEVKQKLIQLGFSEKECNKKRSILYELLITNLKEKDLRNFVKECLMKRTNWRHREQQLQYDGLFPPTSK
jgi:hypothetical protein